MISLHVVVDNAPPEVLDRSITYLKRTKQPFVNVAGGSQVDRAMQFVERCQIEVPNIQIFWRVLEDTGNMIQMDNQTWWSQRVAPRLGWMQEHHVIMVVDNETSGDDAIINTYVNKSIGRMEMLHKNKLYGAFCRFATGTIQDGSQPGQSNQYPLLKPLLEALDARDWISPNEYSNTPGKSSSGHLERYKRILGVVPNKHFNVAIGECGVLNNYGAREGYTTIPISGKEAAAQLIADEIWYKGGTIPRFWFARGGYGDWARVQVGTDALEFLEGYYQQNPIPSPEPPIVIPPPPPVVTPPPYKPPPFTPGMRYVVTVPADFVNVREQPNTVATKLGEIPNKAVITVFEESLVNGDYWRKVHFAELIGWISLQKGAVEFAPYLGDSPSTVTIPIDLLVSIQNGLQKNANTARQLGLLIAEASDDLQKDFTLVKAILDKLGGGQ